MKFITLIALLFSSQLFAFSEEPTFKVTKDFGDERYELHYQARIEGCGMYLKYPLKARWFHTNKNLFEEPNFLEKKYLEAFVDNISENRTRGVVHIPGIRKIEFPYGPPVLRLIIDKYCQPKVTLSTSKHSDLELLEIHLQGKVKVFPPGYKGKVYLKMKNHAEEIIREQFQI